MNKLIFIFLFLFFNNSLAVPVIFKTNKSILVRTPQGAVYGHYRRRLDYLPMKGLSALLLFLLLLPCGQASALPNIFSSALKVRSPSGVSAGAGKPVIGVSSAADNFAAIVRGEVPVHIGSASVTIPVGKLYSGSSIATAAAGAILGGSALGLLATLALPYAIDAVTDQFVKQIPGTQTEPVVDGTGSGNCAYVCSHTFPPGTTITAFNQWMHANVAPEYLTDYRVIDSGATTYYRYYSGTTIIAALNVVTSTITNTCTAPSVYDSALDMCIGSAINEPANAEILAADIEATFNDNPTFPKVALDAVLDADQEPANGQQEIEMPSPQTVPGESKTSTKQYFDPATGHPVTEETTEQTDYKVEKTGPNQLDVKPTTSTTVNITDNVTNVTTTTTNISETSPTEASTETEPQTDCDKYPDAVGCLELGDTGTPDELQTSNVDASINPASWGSGSCPADVAVAGHFMTGAFFSYAPVCQFLSSLAPALIGLGWLIAGWFVLGGVRD